VEPAGEADETVTCGTRFGRMVGKRVKKTGSSASRQHVSHCILRRIPRKKIRATECNTKNQRDSANLAWGADSLQPLNRLGRCGEASKHFPSPLCMREKNQSVRERALRALPLQRSAFAASIRRTKGSSRARCLPSLPSCWSPLKVGTNQE
jgi:hypothetical protein